jgi:hypothetical protein
MAAIDLHPDIVAAIKDLSDSKLGKRYDKMARRRYGVPGWKLAGKTVAGEFGGRSTEAGRGVVSSAGARGPAQFIPSTRRAYIDRHGVDPWKDDRSAIKGLMLHQLDTGVEGYNPGDPNYKNYVLGQKLNRQDRRALRSDLHENFTSAPGSRTEVKTTSHTIPGRSLEPERRAARRELLLSGDINMDKLLAYKASVNSMRDVPARQVSGLKVTKTQGSPEKRGGMHVAPKIPGGIYEVFYDPLGRYWDSGQVNKGAIGGHGGHVHVSADKKLVVRYGRLAQSMGLDVSENPAFDPVDPVHTEGSFHYENMAIDVSGEEKKLRKFARMMMREAKHGRGR